MATSGPIRTNWHESKKHSDVERWICIYPAYLNSKRTRQEGRRLPKDKCVENPTFAEIKDVLNVTNLKVVVENKQYSREKSREMQFRGRVRVQMRNDDGSYCNGDFTSRESIMLFVANKIPQLKSRQNRNAHETNQAFQQSHHSSGTSTTGSGGGGGKKNKGKRR